MTSNDLGEYLRARRESLRPADVGLADDGRRRRVEGLRREGVALLAGISSEYYLRLEQGRERHPSAQVLSAIARALRLAPPAEEFMQRLVHPLPDRGHATGSSPLALNRLDAFISAVSLPAFAHDRVLEVLVANPRAEALSPSFRAGVNLMQASFLDPQLRSLYRNWEDMTSRLVAYLRAQAATPPHDERLDGLVDELSYRSERFAYLWARHEVGAVSSGVNLLSHPIVGELEVNFERLCFAGTDHPVVLIYHATPGTPSEDALQRLASRALSTP
jgi:transcriptional regulator with XRE-family HTH domain